MQRDTAPTRLRSESGATAVEYGIMLAAIAAAIIVVALAVGGLLPPIFQSVVDGLS